MKRGFHTQPSNGLEVVIARSFREIENIRPSWEEMQSSESYPVPNTDPKRYLSILEVNSEQMQPYIMLVKQNGRPSAMVIARLEKHVVEIKLGYKTLLSPELKCLTVVYEGILGKIDPDTIRIVQQEFKNILHRGEVDIIFFNHLRTDSLVYQLATKSANFLCRSHFLKVESHWETHIPDSIEAFYNTIPSKYKREWRRCLRKLEEECGGSVEVTCYREPKDIAYITNVASKISALTYKNALNVGFVDNPQTRSMLTQAARDGWLRAYILYAGGEPCAFEFGICYGDAFIPEYMGFDTKWSSFGPGALLWVKVIEDICIDSAINVLDYGFGDADYKEKLGTKSRPEASVYIFAPRLYPVFINMLQSLLTGLFSGLGYVVNKIALTGWVKRRWRNLLQNSGSC
ncbi:MAG: GNAT family N-acetyltransferase [Phycisphaerae bacterium]|nr:GNAT family N-acetyltransferase [Phycisphaerae bacterium]